MGAVLPSKVYLLQQFDDLLNQDGLIHSQANNYMATKNKDQ